MDQRDHDDLRDTEAGEGATLDPEGVRAGVPAPDGADSIETIPSGTSAAHEGARDGAAIPRTIGAYRIVRRIATGGMGAVYEAEQDNPHRSVALKVIRPGRASEANLRRFAHEAEILGRLHHAGIAQVYEAGAADTGFGPQPYFAMEFVDGEALTVYANQQGLDARARLELVCRVCDAVEHAHQKGVIHRDLKPSNILVDATGQPKVLDFGVARSIDSDLQATMMTQTGELVGTLSYMSPEQVAGDPAEIDTRSDVYALGVLTYELLTDELPYRLAGRGITEIARIIREQEPSGLGNAEREYRGDVETIVAKALEKDKARRYQSVAELAADIRRYLADQPILARPPSLPYQLGKLARRHRAAFAAGGVALLALVVGLIGTGYGLLEARRAAAQAEAMNEYLLQDLLTSADPRSNYGPDVRVVDVLDRAAARLEQRFVGEPELEADMSVALARSYMGLNLYEPAAELLDRAEGIRTRAYGDRDPRTLEVRHRAAALMLGTGDYASAAASLTELLAAQRDVLGPAHRDTLTTQADLADAIWRAGDLEAAIDIKRQVVEARRRALGAADPDTHVGTAALADMLSEAGEFEEAERLFLEALDGLRPRRDTDGVSLVRALHGLSQLYWRRAQNEAAEELAREAIDVASAVYGDDHPARADSMTSLAFALRRLDEFAAAEELLRQAHAIYEERLGPDAESTMTSVHNLANIIADQDRFDEAEQMHLENMRRRERILGEEHPAVAYTLGGMGGMYNGAGDYDRGAEFLREALRIFRSRFDEAHPEIATTLSNLAFALQRGERFEEAVPVLRELMRIDTAQLGRSHIWVLNEYEDLMNVYLDLGDFAAAEQVARERLEITDADVAESDDNYWESRLLLGQVFFRQGRYAEAERWMVEAFEGIGPEPDLDDVDVRETISALALLYEDWGRADDAARYRAMLPVEESGVGR